MIGSLDALVAQLDRVFGYEPKGQGFESLRAHQFGKWLNLVEHLVWDQGVAGSNPVFPTILIIKRNYSIVILFFVQPLCSQSKLVIMKLFHIINLYFLLE